MDGFDGVLVKEKIGSEVGFCASGWLKLMMWSVADDVQFDKMTHTVCMLHDWVMGGTSSLKEPVDNSHTL